MKFREDDSYREQQMFECHIELTQNEFFWDTYELYPQPRGLATCRWFIFKDNINLKY